jgi:hypothetical protein
MIHERVKSQVLKEKPRSWNFTEFWERRPKLPASPARTGQVAHKSARAGSSLYRIPNMCKHMWITQINIMYNNSRPCWAITVGQPDWGLLWFSSVPPDKFWSSINDAKTVCFVILFNSSFRTVLRSPIRSSLCSISHMRLRKRDQKFHEALVPQLKQSCFCVAYTWFLKLYGWESVIRNSTRPYSHSSSSPVSV